MNKLKGIEDKWKLFGSQLGVPSSTLNVIADEKSDDHCLNDVLDMWFDNNYSENNLETLCNALKNIENKRLANEIDQYISSKLYRYYIFTFVLSFLLALPQAPPPTRQGNLCLCYYYSLLFLT